MIRRAMKSRFGNATLLLLLVVLAAFVWHTSQALPPIVASNFSASGAANSFMPRGTYVTLGLGLVVGVPLFVAFAPVLLAGRSASNLGIPNRQYWLAPERREATIAFVQTHCRWFAIAIALFLSYVHWLVLRANELQPPVLSTFAFVSGILIFVLVLLMWMFILFARFRKRV